MASAAMSGDDNQGKVVRMITLISADNQWFKVSEAAASLSETISNMIEDDCADGAIPLPVVTGSVLAKVLEYCNKHAAAAAAAQARCSSALSTASDPYQDLASFDKEFIDVELAMLYDLLMAANYLDIKGLLDIATQKVADMIKGKTPEQIRQTFGIKNDFTPEEEEEIRKENTWAFDE